MEIHNLSGQSYNVWLNDWYVYKSSQLKADKIEQESLESSDYFQAKRN